MMQTLQELLSDPDHLLLDTVVLTLLILAAFMVIRIHDLLASAVILGVFSLLMALLYLLFDAPDVALTEAAVGAGISTVLFLCTLAFTEREQRVSSTARIFVPLFVVIVVGSALIYATADLPAFASPDSPIHHHVAPYYLEHMQEDIAIPNYVTAILGSYRGFDTLGEVAVIFTAAIGITALLMNAPQIRPTGGNTPYQRPAPPTPVGRMKRAIRLQMRKKTRRHTARRRLREKAARLEGDASS